MERMRIRFDHPAAARLDFKPGDEIVVSVMTPELERLVGSARLDGVKVARLVDEEEVAVIDRGDAEVAVTGRQRRHVSRPASVAG